MNNRRRCAGSVSNCVEINQCVGCTRQFFTKSFLGDDVAVLARSSGLKYDLTKGVGLYDLRYVRVGKISSSFKRYASKKAPQDRCLSLFCAGSKTIDLEVLGDAKERDAFAWAFDKIIGEARATRIFVDKAGAPVARSEPKKRLRMILGAH